MIQLITDFYPSLHYKCYFISKSTYRTLKHLEALVFQTHPTFVNGFHSDKSPPVILLIFFALLLVTTLAHLYLLSTSTLLHYLNLLSLNRLISLNNKNNIMIPALSSLNKFLKVNDSINHRFL